MALHFELRGQRRGQGLASFRSGVRSRSSPRCGPTCVTVSDPRLSGEVARRWNEDVYQTDDGAVAVNTTADFLQNDEGGWACSSAILYKGYGLFATPLTGKTATCVGQGGYQGLSAILVEDESDDSHPFVGLIFSGGRRLRPLQASQLEQM